MHFYFQLINQLYFRFTLFFKIHNLKENYLAINFYLILIVDFIECFDYLKNDRNLKFEHQIRLIQFIEKEKYFH